MSEAPDTGGKAGYRAAISAFLQERLQAKLDKLKPDDPQRDEVIASFAHDVWLACAAKRVEQIQAVTHSLKPIHADARGTNLYVEPRTLPHWPSWAATHWVSALWAMWWATRLRWMCTNCSSWR